MHADRLPFHPRAVLFDLDGTLVDSEREIMEILTAELAARGRPLSEQERHFVIGHGWSEIYEFLRAHGPLPLSQQELEEVVYLVRQDRIERNGARELPGAAATVRRISQRLPCALVTGSSRAEAEMVLRALGIAGCFRALCCAGEYARGKPAPDPYLLAAQRLGVQPERCLAIEDAAAGIAAARAAGMYCIAVRAGNFAGQDQSGAHLQVATLEEVDALLDGG